MLLQQKAHVLAALFRGEQLDTDQLSALLADIARPLLGESVGEAQRA